MRGSPGPIQYVRFECSDGVSKDVVVDVARKMNYVRKKIEGRASCRCSASLFFRF